MNTWNSRFTTPLMTSNENKMLSIFRLTPISCYWVILILQTAWQDAQVICINMPRSWAYFMSMSNIMQRSVQLGQKRNKSRYSGYTGSGSTQVRPLDGPLLTCLLWLGWHTGTAQVSEVQPAPVPAKPIPMACFTRTHTANPQVLGNTAGTCKPIPVFHYFSIST